jgi:hypothetical protein
MPVASPGPPDRLLRARTLPRYRWEWLRISQALSPHKRPDLARPRTPIRYDSHRPVSRLSASRWPRTVFPLDRRRRPCNLPLGLHHRGASLPHDRRVLTRTRLHPIFYGRIASSEHADDLPAARRTSESGQKRKGSRGTSVLPSGADIVSLPRHVRLVPDSEASGWRRWIRGLEPGGALRFNR